MSAVIVDSAVNVEYFGRKLCLALMMLIIEIF